MHITLSYWCRKYLLTACRFARSCARCDLLRVRVFSLYMHEQRSTQQRAVNDIQHAHTAEITHRIIERCKLAHNFLHD
jgi:hypothetical protein